MKNQPSKYIIDYKQVHGAKRRVDLFIDGKLEDYVYENHDEVIERWKKDYKIEKVVQR